LLTLSVFVPIVELGAGLEDVSGVLKDCGFQGVIADVEKIVSAFKEGEGAIVEIVVKELIGIFVKRKLVFNDVSGAIAAWKIADYKTAGFDIGNLVGLLIVDGKR